MRYIYAIIDNLANEIVGQIPLHVFKHENQAKRMFVSVARTQDSYIGKNLQDFDLWYLGTIDNENNITTAKELTMSGKQLKSTIELEAM